jgi:hypothetical protein
MAMGDGDGCRRPALSAPGFRRGQWSCTSASWVHTDVEKTQDLALSMHASLSILWVAIATRDS